MNIAREYEVFKKIERSHDVGCIFPMSSFIKSRNHSRMLVQGKVRGTMEAFHPRDAHQLLFICACAPYIGSQNLCGCFERRIGYWRAR
jgi:hypothetical protein